MSSSVSIPLDPSDWTATSLLIAGVILLLLEIKIVSQGILAFIGTVFLISAAVLIWQDGTPFWGIPVGWIIPSIGLVILLAGLLSWLAIQAQKEKVVMGYQGFIGEIAEASEDFDPEGSVFFNGTYWHAVSPVPVTRGDKVRVIAADRLKLIVEPLARTASAHGEIFENESGHV
jgi:membrane-bound serine protease (ClpP class)